MSNADEPKKDSNEWRPLLTSRNAIEAELIVARLEASGIPARIDQESVGRILGFSSGPLGEVRVLVAREDYDAARETLATDEELGNDL